MDWYKHIEFQTSKGRFILCDENLYLQNINGIKTAIFNGIRRFKYDYFIRLSNITEGQAEQKTFYNPVIFKL